MTTAALFAHGGGAAGFDELALLAAVALVAFGVVRLTDPEARSRVPAIAAIVVGLVVGITFVVVRLSADAAALSGLPPIHRGGPQL